MNNASVIIEDDDVVMVGPVEKPKNVDKRGKSNQVIIDIVDLDEEPLSTPTNREGSSTSKNGETVVNVDRDSSFARLLKNNTILNKIIQRCRNMENNGGMSRVIHKTLLPLYKEADNKFKESETFSKVLFTILRNLKTDPDRKFLHIKSLCEELKAGKYRRKVPFVTLTTDLKPNHTPRLKAFDPVYIPTHPELLVTRDTSHRSVIAEENEPNIRTAKVRKVQTQKYIQAKFKKYCNSRKLLNKRRKKRKTVNKKTDVVNLDNSDDETVITLDADDESDGGNDDIMIVGDTKNNDDNSNHSNKENTQIMAETDTANGTDSNLLELQNPYENNNVFNNKENGEIEAENYKACYNDGNFLVPQNSDQINNCSNNKNSETDEEDDAVIDVDINCVEPQNIEVKNSQIETENEITSSTDNDLLVPQNSVEVEEHYSDLAKAHAIEQQIAFCKQIIMELEEKEVTNNFNSSPYIQCDKYKAKIVELYKKLCKLTGNGDGNLMKQRVVRLHVAEGHPPGPVRRLERYLNSTIDETGAVPLPDFHDVIRCVNISNIKDNLCWNKQQIMREALALFTYCGHALRKSRQKREYKDLLSLVRDKAVDDYDPANEDPQLLAKLEENKLIAKAKEDEILDRYSRMEYLSNNLDISSNISGKFSRIITPADDSDTESATEEDSAPRKKLREELSFEGIKNSHTRTPTEGNHNKVVNGSCQRPLTNKEIIKYPTATTIEDSIKNVVKVVQTDITLPQIQLNTKAPIKNTLIIRTPNEINTSQNLQITSTQNTLNTSASKSLITNTTCPSYFYTTQNMHATILNALNTIQNQMNTTQNLSNVTTQNTLNTIQNAIDTPQNLINTTLNSNNTRIQKVITPNMISLNSLNKHRTANQISWPNTVQKIGCSNRYVVAYDSKSSEISEPEIINKGDNTENYLNASDIRSVTEVANGSKTSHNNELGNRNDCLSIETNFKTSISETQENVTVEEENQENVIVKDEKSIKEEPVDIQYLLDALGDNYISTIFDIEDPFLVIEISSDSSDDEL